MVESLVGRRCIQILSNIHHQTKYQIITENQMTELKSTRVRNTLRQITNTQLWLIYTLNKNSFDNLFIRTVKKGYREEKQRELTISNVTWEENQATDLTNIRLLRNLYPTISFPWFRTPPSPSLPKTNKGAFRGPGCARRVVCGKTWPQKNGNFFFPESAQKKIHRSIIKNNILISRNNREGFPMTLMEISTNFSHKSNARRYANIPTNPVGGFWGGPWPPNPTP